MEQKLPRALPSEAGVNPQAVLQFVKTLDENVGTLHSLMILRHGKVIAEGWWAPYRPQETHMVYSFSKGLTSCAIGFAVQEGLLTVDDPVLSFFPGVLPSRPCENMEKMKVKHLLTMATGHTEPPNVEPYDNWAYRFLSSYVPLEPGSKFQYNTAASHMLSAIIQKLSGKTLEEYLRPRLFEPLGIVDYWWEKSSQGITTGGFGCNLKTEDMAKFGLFYLNKGKWNGKQLLDPAWIEASTSWQVDNRCHSNGDWGAGYGYQFWMCQPENTYRADGAFGQLCVTMPDQDALVIITGATTAEAALMDPIWEILMPAMTESPLPSDPQSQNLLEEKLGKLTLCPPYGTLNPEDMSLLRFSDIQWELSANLPGFTQLQLHFGDSPVVTLCQGKYACTLPIGTGCWADGFTFAQEKAPGKISSNTSLYQRVSCAGAWEGNDYILKMIYRNTPYEDTLRFVFRESGPIIHFRRNVSFQPEYPLTIFCH